MNYAGDRTKKLCENCGHQLKGRSDKRFCDDSCRNTFNHRKRIPDNEVTSPVINSLKKNRSILLQLLEKEKRSVTKEQLLELGYNFKCCTNHKFLDGESYYFCFDVGYQGDKGGRSHLMTTNYFNFLVDYFLEESQRIAQMPDSEKEAMQDIGWSDELSHNINSEPVDLTDLKRKFSNLTVISADARKD